MEIGTVVVTGSSGLIGTAVTKSLLDRDLDVYAVDIVDNRWSDQVAAITETADLRKIDLSSIVPESDLVLHFAATARVSETIEYPERATDNLRMTRRVLDYAAENDAGVVYPSSREVYGEAGVAREDDASIDAGKNPYAASKIGGEALIHSYRRCFGVHAVVLRYGNVYGRYDDSDRVVPTFIAKALAGDTLEIHGSSKLLDFVHVDDCIRGTLAAVDRIESVHGETINLASGEGTTLEGLAEVVLSATENDSDVRRSSDRQGEVNRFVGDIGKAQALLDYTPRFDLEAGISDAVEWYRANPKIRSNILK
jgi:UDP-glucose 4-epimerase